MKEFVNGLWLETRIVPTYYSEFGEDQWIVENLKLPPYGVCVDVGASNGIKASNSYCFELAGWTCLCVDADPRNSESLRKNRRIAESCAVTDKPNDPKRRFAICNNSADLSGMAREGEWFTPVNVPIFTLEDLLQKHGIRGPIDVLSIDTEGTEADVWASFDRVVHRPSVVVIEWNTAYMPPTDQQLDAMMAGEDYRQVHRTQANLIFVDKRNGRLS